MRWERVNRGRYYETVLLRGGGRADYEKRPGAQEQHAQEWWRPARRWPRELTPATYRKGVTFSRGESLLEGKAPREEGFLGERLPRRKAPRERGSEGERLLGERLLDKVVLRENGSQRKCGS